MEQLLFNVVPQVPKHKLSRKAKAEARKAKAEARRQRYRELVGIDYEETIAGKPGKKDDTVDAMVDVALGIKDQIDLVLDFRKRRGRPKGSRVEPNHNDHVWTDEDVYLIMDGMLHQARKALDNGTPVRERKSVLAWVAEPLDPPSANPFSFLACCKAFGLDAEWLQERILEAADLQILEEDQASKESASA
ncbi:hypothetical protein TK90_2871 (plasmid) [Thioalkalivibrio sp. K90mix]|uniref:hypothetical protein n=1 Tax=Thioalkalivibrio sp. (strain K90mix) TaxID=396595 RepID=UPI000195A947|nr:hypothetical protein [Thioalkalivibrio sp. K90mix]ADC73355.1 hypothetical protein TK90_2871 [Thioalkalivibrio sp. K90mix]